MLVAFALIVVALAVALDAVVVPIEPHVRAAARGDTAGVHGVDVSVAVTQEQFACMRQEGNVSFVIVRCFRSTGVIDANCVQTMKNAKAAGMEHVDAYHFPHMDTSPLTQVKDSIMNLQKNNVTFEWYWLDIETFNWPSNHGANLDFIANLALGANDMGHHIGIYSSESYSWKPITGDSDEFDYAPLWWARYEDAQNFTSFSPFGGWDLPAIHQYSGSATLCGVGVDLNWAPEYPAYPGKQ